MTNTRQPNTEAIRQSNSSDPRPLFVRPASLTIEGLKNVEHGHIDFDNGREPDYASVTGICGQNGSGKTAVIDACHILANVLAGVPAPSGSSQLINVQAEEVRFTWTFTLFNAETPDVQKAEYSFAVRRRRSEDGTAANPQIVDEVLKTWRKTSSGRCAARVVMDTTSGDPFRPASQVRALTGGGTLMHAKLLALKEQALEQGSFYIFSERFLQTLDAGHDEEARRLLLPYATLDSSVCFPSERRNFGPQNPIT